MSYGPDQVGQWRAAATYVDPILRGEKPSELPVQVATNYETVVNLVRSAFRSPGSRSGEQKISRPDSTCSRAKRRHFTFVLTRS
jgi:ABC-type uncharacterized transport system substrate-binding protein